MSFLDFPGLQYFYNKYLKPIKPHAREETIKSYTVNEQGHVPDAQLVAQLKEENESLQAKVEALNSSLTFVNAENNPDLFEKNFLLINASQEHGIAQTTTYFSKPEEDSDWQNVPSTLQGRQWVGIRKVYRRNNTHVLVEIVEMYPVSGRTWYIFYNNEKWTSWRSVSPAELD